MHCQALSHEINILLQAFFYFFNLYGFFRASAYAFRFLSAFTYAIIALRIKIGDKILKNNPEWAGHGTRLATRAAHLITFDMPVA